LELGLGHISGDKSVVKFVQLFVVMQKVKVGQKTELQVYLREFEGEITKDNKIM
jgi:hypothetical protein